MASLRETFACVPGTERGRGILIAGDAKSNTIAYTNGRSVVLRSLSNPLELDVYGEHGYNVTVARFSPNGEWVASGDVSGVVRIWARRGEHILKLEMKALTGRVDDLDWSADGERIVVSGDAKGSTFLRAFLWDSGAGVGEFDGHSKRVLSCSFKPTRPIRIASCGEDFLVNYYEGPPFRFMTSHREHSNFANCVRFSLDGSMFITLASDKKGLIFNGKTGEKMGELCAKDGHAGSIYAASWSPSSTQVLTVSADKTAKVWDIMEDGSGHVNTTFLCEQSGGVQDMQVGCLWLGEYLITVSLGGIISYLSLADPSYPARVVSGHLKSITSIAVVKHGEEAEILSSSYDAVVVRWRVGFGYLGRLDVMDKLASLSNIKVAADKLFATGLDNKMLTATLQGEILQNAVTLDLGAPARDLDVLSSSEGELILVPADAEVLLLRGSTILSRTTVKYLATAAALAPAGKEAVVGGQDGRLYVYSVIGEALVEKTVLEKHRGPITVVQFSPDGSLLASGDQNREAVVWSRGTENVQVKNMLYHTARINCVAWSPDNLWVATGSVDSCIYVYDVTKPASTRIMIKGAHLGAVSAIAFTNPKTFVSGGDDACVRVWDLPYGVLQFPG